MVFNYDIQNAFYRLKLYGVKFFSIGTTALNKPILCTHLGGHTGKQIIVQGAIHAREYISTLLICRQIEYIQRRILKGEDILKEDGIYFIPMVNPDGVDICINGTENVRCNMVKDQLLNANKNSNDFRMFKANSNLVDLNVNFDADWGKGRFNKKYAGLENFIGYFKESEAEVKALVKLTKKVSPALTISYHSKGNVLYYKYKQSGSVLKSHRELAKNISKQTGYKISSVYKSVGGYKDYCIDKLRIPALTIELGDEELSHPIGKENLNKILLHNLKTPLFALDIV